MAVLVSVQESKANDVPMVLPPIKMSQSVPDLVPPLSRQTSEYTNQRAEQAVKERHATYIGLGQRGIDVKDKVSGGMPFVN